MHFLRQILSHELSYSINHSENGCGLVRLKKKIVIQSNRYSLLCCKRILFHSSLLSRWRCTMCKDVTLFFKRSKQDSLISNVGQNEREIMERIVLELCCHTMDDDYIRNSRIVSSRILAFLNQIMVMRKMVVIIHE